RIYAVAFSDDSHQLATGSCDNAIRLWDPKTGSQLSAYRMHRACIRKIAFSRDGARIISTSDELIAHVWDARTTEQLASFHHDDHFTHVAFNEDGQRILTITISKIEKKAQLWEAATGKLLTEHIFETTTDSGAVDSILRDLAEREDSSCQLAL